METIIKTIRRYTRRAHVDRLSHRVVVHRCFTDPIAVVVREAAPIEVS